MSTKKTLISILAVGTLFSSPIWTYAESSQGQLNQVQSQLQNKQQELQGKQQEKTQAEIEIQTLQKKLDDLNSSITNTQNQLIQTQNDIKNIQNEIQKKKESIEQLQRQIENRQKVISKRLTSLQEKPRTNIITEIVINTKNIADLLENLYSVNLILNSDSDILKEQDRDQKAVMKEKEIVEDKEKTLKGYEETLSKKKQELDANKQQEQGLLQELNNKLAKLNTEIESTEEAKSILENQRKAIQQNIDAEERAKQERARQPIPVPNTGQDIATPPAPTKSGFIKPANGRFSSGFGRRPEMHYGQDIASGGTVPIVAAAGGIVIRSEFSTSYGNVVYISHRINGQIYTTVYAHMQSRAVSTGQTVQQGQQIGIMGNTGQSDGQHLHFEIHIGEWNAAKTNAVDPRPYIE